MKQSKSNNERCFCKGRGKRRGKAHARLLAGTLLLFCILPLFSACTAKAPDPLAYRTSCFSAEVRGERKNAEDGTSEAFSAKIEHMTDQEEQIVRITYLTPDALSGTQIEACCDKNGSPIGKATLQWEDLCLQASAQSLADLLLPALALLSPSDLQSIQKTEDGYKAIYSGEVELLVAGNGAPKRFSSPQISLDVVWFEYRGTE